MVARRDLWLKALSPEPSSRLKTELRAAPILSEHLFGELSDDRVQAELDKRRDAGVISLLTELKGPKKVEKPRGKPQKAKKASQLQPFLAKPRAISEWFSYQAFV